MAILIQTVLLMLALSISQIAAAEDSPCAKNNVTTNDGTCWNSLGVPTRQWLIGGIWAGMHARATADGMIGRDPGYFITTDWIATPNSTTIGDIQKYFDKFYGTPANRSIQWSDAYFLAAMHVRDDDSNDEAGLLRLLRSGKALPTGAC